MTANHDRHIEIVKEKLREKFDINDEILSLGFPLNPKIKNTIFPNNYLITNNIIVDQKVHELTGSVIELHYQSLSDFTDLTTDEKKEVKEYVNNLRNLNYKFMTHLPFLKQKSEEYFDFDYTWLVVPNKYIEHNRFISKIGGKENYGIEIDLEIVKSFLEFSDFLDIEYATIHATKPGVVLNDSDFKIYKKKIKELIKFISDHSLSVKLAVETGGIMPKHLVELRREYGTMINLDTAHLVLDLEVMNPEMSYFNLNQVVTKFFKEHNDDIKQLHLTQTKLGDQHRPINEEGIVSCNHDILRLIQKYTNSGKSFLTMIESEITSKDWEFVKKAVSDVQYYGYGNAIVNVFMGWPLSGKSSGSQTLESHIGPVISSDQERIYYREAISQNEVVPEKNKNRVYSELFDRLYWKISKGNPSSNIEATFTLKSRREKLFKILQKSYFADAYFWYFLRTEDDVKKRFRLREEMREQYKREGKEFPANILVDYEIYKNFMTDTGPDEKPTIFDVNEIPLDLKDKVHILIYDTSGQIITLYNADEYLREGSRMLTDHRTSLGEDAPVVKEI